MSENEVYSACQSVRECLLAHNPEGVLVLDDSGCVVDANPAFTELTGYILDELLTQSIFDLVETTDEPSFRSVWPEILDQSVRCQEVRVRSKDAQMLILQMTFCQPSCCESTLVGVFCKDLTDRIGEKQMMRLQTHALATAANAVVITDADGRIIWVNRAFSTFTGFTPDEAIGTTPGTLLKSGRHSEAFYREMWQTVMRGEVWQGELINRRKDGTLYPEEMTITPLHDEEGTICNYIAIKQDLTKRKELEQMFLRSQRMESIGTLASGIAHDLNNVLAPIVMSSDLLMMQTEDEQTRDMLMMIKEGAKRGADIIRQLLTFARGEEEEMAELQLRHLLKQLVKVYRETFPKNIELDARVSPDLLPVMGEATHLHQVFINLLINARDAMPEGGTILISGENVVVDSQWAGLHPHARAGHFARIRIQDQGTGIPESLREKIFNSFFTTKPIGKGTGLGLATVLTIVKAHKGFVLLESTENVGSTFDVFIPVCPDHHLDPAKREEDEIPMGSGEQLLVIDDEESICFMLRGTLATLGYQVAIATSGADGLKWIETYPGGCELILLDMMMPGLDGSEVIRRLKDMKCDAKILIMSGMVSEEKLLETGVDLKSAFLSKPFTILELAQKIQFQLNS
ncbi:MAG: PAS domain-containing protein [Kiritimatiellia bacterium]